MKRIIFVLAVVFCSCALSQNITTPSGKQGFAITCPAEGFGTGLCYKKAGQQCPQGYNIISQHQTQPKPQININVNNNGTQTTDANDSTDDDPELTLIIECK